MDIRLQKRNMPAITAGIQAGDAAGMSVVCIPDMKRPDQVFLDKTAAVLDSLNEVISYLEKSVKTSPE